MSTGPYHLPPLEACPLCRSSLPEGPTPAQCPSCGSELSQYASLRERAQELLLLAAEALARGDYALAEEVASGLEFLVPPAGSGLALLRARLALARSDWTEALEQARQLEPPDSSLIEEQIALCRRLVLEARELYNSALAACRAGEFISALGLLERACRLDSANAALWSLRLKAALKAGSWGSAREAAAALDRQGARPAWLGTEDLAALPGLAAARRA